MASETTAANVNRFTNTFVLVGIITLGLIGILNIFSQRVGEGLGFAVTALILLRIFVWLEKAKLRNVR